MKITQLIEKLEELKKIHGDRKIVIIGAWRGGSHSAFSINMSEDYYQEDQKVLGCNFSGIPKNCIVFDSVD